MCQQDVGAYYITHGGTKVCGSCYLEENTIYKGSTMQIVKSDNINPDHYKSGGIELIDVLEAKLGLQGFKGFLAGNVLKYVVRYDKKNGVEDLQKALWYLNKLIGTVEKDGEQ
jgi:hypothetical protein